MNAELEINPTSVRSVCRGCGNEGRVEMLTPEPGKKLTTIRPLWCTCKPRKSGAASGGPYEAPKGYIAKFTFGDEP